MIGSREGSTAVNIQVSAGPDQGGHEAALRHILKPQVRSTRALGIALVSVGAVQIVAAVAFRVATVYLPVGMVLVLLGYYFIWSVGRSAVVAVRNLGRASRSGHDYTITDKSLTVSGPYQHAVSTWYLFTGATELPGQVIFMVTPTMFVPVPTDRMTPAELQELRAFLAGRDWTQTGPPVGTPEVPAGQ